MYDIKVLNNKCKMGGGDVGPQCFLKHLLWVVYLVCKKEDSVSCWFKVHQPRQGQRLTGMFFLFVCYFFFYRFKDFYTYTSCLGGVFAKNTSLKMNISRAERRGKFSLKAGISRKYPSQTWYICLIPPSIIYNL
jgi:hypothetical protein